MWSQLREAVVMLCGPHHEAFDAARALQCPATHEGTRCYARIVHAISVALELEEVPLIIVAGADEHGDAAAFAACAQESRVRTYVAADLRLAAELLVRDPVFAGTEAVRLVTDPWHMPRAAVMTNAVMLQPNIRTAKGEHFALRTSDVEPFWQPPSEVIEQEKEAFIAFIEGTPTVRHLR